MDPEACSRACVASSTCKGSLYSAQPANRRAPCFLYSGATEPVLEDMDRVLWMSYRKVSPLDPVDCKEELELVGELEDKVSGLQREMEQLKKDLEACQASSGGEEGDGGDNGGGEEGGEKGGNDGGSGTGLNDAVLEMMKTSLAMRVEDGSCTVTDIPVMEPVRTMTFAGIPPTSVLENVFTSAPKYPSVGWYTSIKVSALVFLRPDQEL
ncbi:hypothetical protein AtubIFM61612_004199 [Aspergillus tubingensis]|nr:hypothetical protein AtubIFM61612_004199 [Aspergillus tubingensis]